MCVKQCFGIFSRFDPERRSCFPHSFKRFTQLLLSIIAKCVSRNSGSIDKGS
jgi:hypothetical protein